MTDSTSGHLNSQDEVYTEGLRTSCSHSHSESSCRRWKHNDTDDLRVRGQESGVRGQVLEVRSQGSGVRGQGLGVRGQGYGRGKNN